MRFCCLHEFMNSFRCRCLFHSFARCSVLFGFTFLRSALCLLFIIVLCFVSFFFVEKKNYIIMMCSTMCLWPKTSNRRRRIFLFLSRNEPKNIPMKCSASCTLLIRKMIFFFSYFHISESNVFYARPTIAPHICNAQRHRFDNCIAAHMMVACFMRFRWFSKRK